MVEIEGHVPTDLGFELDARDVALRQGEVLVREDGLERREVDHVLAPRGAFRARSLELFTEMLRVEDHGRGRLDQHQVA